MTSLKRNVISSYASQIYTAAAGIAVIPIYLHRMGAEAFGLIGFYSMLQAWFMLLDVGLTPTMIRQTALYRGGAMDASELRRFVRTLEGIFLVVGVLGAGVVIASSRFIADSWLKVQKLPLVEVRRVIIIIAVIMALRWMSGLYKGAVNGFEQLVWLGGFNIIIATLRFILVIPVLIYVSAAPIAFFTYLLFVALLEFAILAAKTYRLMPTATGHVHWELTPLKGVLGFSLIVAFTSSIWVVVTQTDKLVLSKLLPLSEYAYFTLAVLLAGGVNLLGSPISGALLPRMVKIHAEGDESGMIHLYRNATQMVAVITVPACLVLAFFSRQILIAWTGSAAAAHASAAVLTLYALGNGLLSLCSFPYYLQFAYGDLKLHLIGSALFVAILVPSIIWGTLHFGVTGAGYAWLATNLLYFLLWVPTVHQHFAKGLHPRWLLHDIAGIVTVAVIGCVAIKPFVPWLHSRAAMVCLFLLVGAILVAIAATASSWVRKTIMQRYLPGFEPSSISWK